MNRIKKTEKKIGYTLVSNKFLNDERVSFKAKGIFMYLWSKPDGWKVNVKNITNYGTEGDKAVRSAMHELKDLGYIKWIPVQSGYDYFIDDEGGLLETEEVKEIKEEKKVEKANVSELPTYIDKNLWKEYKLMRKQIRKPMTPYAEKRNLLELEKFETACNGAANEALNKSICNSWVGLFNPNKSYGKAPVTKASDISLLEKLRETWNE